MLVHFSCLHTHMYCVSQGGTPGGIICQYYHNMGALFLVKNKQVSNRMKHIDIRHHFIREIKERGELITEHVEDEGNKRDILTKNPSVEIFKHH